MHMLTVNIPAIDGLEVWFARPALASNRKIAFQCFIAVRDRFTRGIFFAVPQALEQRKSLMRREELGILYIWGFHKLGELNTQRRQEQTMYR